MEGTERDKFLGAFYDNYVIWLVEPINHLGHFKGEIGKEEDGKKEEGCSLTYPPTHPPI